MVVGLFFDLIEKPFMQIQTKFEPPLCVDLDGSLLATDVLWESFLLLLKSQPWKLFSLPFWLLKGKAHLKRKIATLTELNVDTLPVRKDVLSFVMDQHQKGREILLATATDKLVADKIASRFGFFTNVLASDGHTNLSGRRKLAALKKDCGKTGFDYVGDAEVDLPIWQASREAMLVQPSSQLLRKAEGMCSVKKVFQGQTNKLLAFIKAIRVYQWVKNLLLFIPLLTAHKIADLSLLLQAFWAFVAFSLCASSVYVLNDLLDLESDRAHLRKKKRPFAAGTLQIKTGLLTVPILLTASFAVANVFLPPLFLVALGTYLVTTTAYSFYFKRILIVDVLILAGLYTFRVLAGGMAVGIVISTWLLAFSMFFFVSLAFIKRYSELQLMKRAEKRNRGRGYNLIDIELIRSVGPTSGYLSMLVLALYINSTEVVTLYRDPSMLWLIGPFLFYWITRIWFRAHRGKMDDDPIVFTVKDPRSYVIGGIVGGIIFLASRFSFFKDLIQS